MSTPAAYRIAVLLSGVRGQRKNYEFSGDTLMRSWQGLKQFGFISEVLVISTMLSYLIKYGGPYLSISATSLNALLIVVMPTIVMAIALLARYTLACRRVKVKG